MTIATDDTPPLALLPRKGHWTAEEALGILREGPTPEGPADDGLYRSVVAWIRRAASPVDRSPESADSLYARVADGAPSAEPGFLSGAAAARVLGYGRYLNVVSPWIVSRFLGLGCPWTTVCPAPGDRVLDIGCGAGLDVAVAASLTGSTGRVIGLDSRSVLFPRKGVLSGNVELRVAEASDTGIPASWASLVVANGLPPLLVGDDEAAVLTEVGRVMAEGGSFVLTALVALTRQPPMPNEELVRAVLTGKPFIAEVRRMLLRAGLEPWGGHVSTPALSGHPHQGHLGAAVVVSGHPR